MIPAQTLPGQPSSWQQSLREAITDPAELLTVLNLDAALLPAARKAAGLFPLRVPRGFVARMQPGDAADPLLRQVLPLVDECAEPSADYLEDAVGDAAATRMPGVIQKYAGRALLVTTGACGVHCRFCFRRHFPYPDSSLARRHWPEMLEFLRKDSTIHEVILSGGDPLSLDNKRLAELLMALGDIKSLRTLRIHTRQPIVLPERVDAELCRLLEASPLRPVVVLHANHGNEIDAEVVAACGRLKPATGLLLNQSVLLRGVNDSAPSLADLSWRLLAARVLPYYLHMPDRVRGTAHFNVPETRARRIMHQLRSTLPGYLVPKLVREVAGEGSKMPIR